MTAVGQKKVSVRTCCVCAEKGDKSSLIRIVKTPEGQVMLDPTGRHPGRGAYLCASVSCFEKARASRKLERALKISIDSNCYDMLEQDFAAMLAKMTSREGADR